MAKRDNHYEAAFEAYLRQRRKGRVCANDGLAAGSAGVRLAGQKSGDPRKQEPQREQDNRSPARSAGDRPQSRPTLPPEMTPAVGQGREAIGTDGVSRVTKADHR